LATVLALTCAGCWRGEPDPVDDPSRLTITLRSPAFADGGMIPKAFTCDGADRSPPLEWSGMPRATESLALICDDPDAPMGTFSHWVVISRKPGIQGFKEGVPAGPEVPADAVIVAEGDTNPKSPVIQCKNDFGKIGYGGPCPPGGTHRYVFRLYALDRPLEGSSELTRADVLGAVKGHILAEGRLIGKYARSK
jgi:Raf kinase inhibitor-like YbhB/YbcL family protein